MPYNPTDDPIPPHLQSVMNDIGSIIGAAIADRGQEGRVGFMLMTFDIGAPGGTVAYISNCDREDVLRVLSDFITHNAQ